MPASDGLLWTWHIHQSTSVHTRELHAGWSVYLVEGGEEAHEEGNGEEDDGPEDDEDPADGVQRVALEAAGLQSGRA